MFLEKQGEFACFKTDKGADIEAWTSLGQNITLKIEPFTIDSFCKAAEEFDIDECILNYIEAKEHTRSFSILDASNDFKEFKDRLLELKEILLKEK